jgi:modulator of FtsH protease
MENAMQQQDHLLNTSNTRSLEVNKVLRNTYMLLSMTLAFSAVMAGISMAIAPPRMTGLICTGLAFVLIMFVIPKTANSEKGILSVFALTGLLGFGLGPMLNAYLQLANGPALIMQALGGTAVVFLGLSAYALTTKKDFSFLGGFLMIGMIVVIIAAIANIFFAIPAISLALSAAIIFIMSGFILFDTSRIINGGETNYILATVSLYLSIYNIFVNLLALLGVMGDD